MKLKHSFHLSSFIIIFTDIDECESNEGKGPCEIACTNLPGSYECTNCYPRAVVSTSTDNNNNNNNQSCQQDATTTTKTTSTSSECGADNAGCSHTCLITMGRAFCLCPVGFMLEDDWKTCQGAF